MRLSCFSYRLGKEKWKVERYYSNILLVILKFYRYIKNKDNF